MENKKMREVEGKQKRQRDISGKRFFKKENIEQRMKNTKE